jgi:hypothetical protein
VIQLQQERFGKHDRPAESVLPGLETARRKQQGHNNHRRLAAAYK